MTSTRLLLLPVLLALIANPTLAFRLAHPPVRVYTPETDHHRLNAIAWPTPTPARYKPTSVTAKGSMTHHRIASVSLFSEQKIRAGVMEQYMRQAPAPTIAGLVHQQNPKAWVVALSG